MRTKEAIWHGMGEEEIEVDILEVLLDIRDLLNSIESDVIDIKGGCGNKMKQIFEKVKEITDRPVTVTVDVAGKEFQTIVANAVESLRIKAAKDDYEKMVSEEKEERERRERRERREKEIFSYVPPKGIWTCTCIPDEQGCCTCNTIKTYWAHKTAIIDKASIGKGTKIWHWTHVSDGAVIGKNCTIGQNVFVGKNVKIGDGCKIQNGVNIFEGVELKDHVFIGPGVQFTNIIRPRAFISQKGTFVRTIIHDGVTIGANSTIVCGNMIGHYSLIGAGSVVTKDVPSYAFVYGNPATTHGSVTREGFNQPEQFRSRGGR